MNKLEVYSQVREGAKTWVTTAREALDCLWKPLATGPLAPDHRAVWSGASPHPLPSISTGQVSTGEARTGRPSCLTQAHNSFSSLGLGSEVPQTLSPLHFRFPTLLLGARRCRVEGTEQGAEVTVVTPTPFPVCRADIHARLHSGLNDAPPSLLKGLSTFQTW